MELEKRSYNRESRLLPFKNFNAEFENQLPAHNSYRSAFEATEQKVGRYYSSYESFKSTRTQNRKGRK